VEYAYQVKEQLGAAGFRVQVDESPNRMQAKIRDAQNMKIPYMLVVGDREAADGAVNLRLRTGEQKGTLSLDELKEFIQAAVASKAVN